MSKNTNTKLLLISFLLIFLSLSTVGVVGQEYSINAEVNDSFLTYFGGSKAEFFTDTADLGVASVTVDSNDNIVFTGRTSSDDYPVTAGAYQSERNDSYDVYLTKINADITLSFSTYLGGVGNDWATCIVTDSNDNIIIAGSTGSNNFPLLSPYQDTNGGGPTYNLDGFIAKFDETGTLLWSTYMGGNSDDWVYGICIDSSDNIVITGSTYSTDLPVTGNAAQDSFSGTGVDAYVIRLSADGQTVQYCSYLGGVHHDWGYSLSYIGDTLVLGGGTGSSDISIVDGIQSFGGTYDILVAKFSSSGSLVFSSYIGGTDTEYCHDMVTDSQGNTYITGFTDSTNFPVTDNALQSTIGGGNDVFVIELNNTNDITYSSYYGSTGDEETRGLALDSSKNVIITGFTDSDDLVNTESTNQNTLAGGDDAFIVEFNATTNNIDYCSYIGGSSSDRGADLTVDSNDNIIVYGFTYSSDLAVTENALQSTPAGQYDIFLNRINLSAEEHETGENGSSSPSFETVIVFISIIPLVVLKKMKKNR